MAVIKIEGMTCQHCVMAVEKALNAIDGVGSVEVSLEKNEASFDEEKPIDMDVVKEKIEKAGYKIG